MKETMSSNGASPSVSMTRLDEPPPPHPNRLVPQSSSQPQAPPSKTHSRASSFSSTASTKSCSDGTLNNVHLTRISETSHLKGLPQDFLSLDPERPLLHIDEKGNEYKYFLQPMKMSVIFILFVEMLERFSFYGINYTTTAYLTGAYNEVWNADMSSIVASSYVSISTAVAYTTPFLGALLADNLLGEYMTILLGTLFCYIPGLLLIALTTIPQLLGEEFNHSAIRWGLLGLWPVGTGAVKACVNVFGAKQFHPILQSSLIETYYVNFYMCINIGALTGGILVPIVAQWNVTVAYFIPVCILGLGVLSFALGTTKYVKPKPKHEMNLFSRNALARISGACGCNNWRRDQRARNAASILIQPKQSKSKIGIGTISLVSALVVPFNVAYAQMSTTFIVQGSVMKNYGLVDASMMNNADAISVLAFGYAIGNIFYPELSKRDIKIPTTYKFAIGSAFGAAAVGCAIATEYQIHRVYDQTGEAISVLWQAFPYFLIGIGEIFAVSAAYEFAFAVSPVSMKSLASAANLFMVGGVPNVFCIMLYNACGSWFINSRGTANIHKLTDYSSAKVVNYFWLLEAVALFGVFVNVLPPIKEWVERIEEAALEDIKSPMSTPVIRKNLLKRKQQRMESSGNDEETPLVRAQKHANYLKYGSGPELVKMGSMRAGPSLKKNRPTNPQRPLRVQSPAAQGSNTTYVKVGSILVPRPNEAPN